MIANRTDCCSDRIKGANVWVRRFGTHKWEHVATLKNTAPTYNVHVGAFRGSYEELAIVADGRARTLAEVFVFGFPLNLACLGGSP